MRLVHSSVTRDRKGGICSDNEYNSKDTTVISKKFMRGMAATEANAVLSLMAMNTNCELVYSKKCVRSKHCFFYNAAGGLHKDREVYNS